MPTLADIYSAIGTARRKASDFVQNPMTSLQQMAGNANDRARALNEMTAAAAEEKELYGPANRALGAKLAEAYNPMGMTVYHGSPHLFERFDLGKMGSGTGQQVYGKGLYMAENPATAQKYQKNVKDLENPGNLYKVDLPDTHVRRMLDFDEPLKNQPKKVRDLAKSLNLDLNDLGGDLLERIGKGEQGKKILQDAGITGIKYYNEMSGGKDLWKRNFVVFDPNHLTILERNAENIK
jgi:hypothetical protein